MATPDIVDGFLRVRELVSLRMLLAHHTNHTSIDN